MIKSSITKATGQPKARSNGARLPSRAKKRRTVAPIDAEHRAFWIRNSRAVSQLGRDTFDAEWPSAYRHTGCIATIHAAIEAGYDTRDDILVSVKGSVSGTYPQIGYLLGQMCGPDPDQHLWYLDADRRYHLHNRASAELKLAA